MKRMRALGVFLLAMAVATPVTAQFGELFGGSKDEKKIAYFNLSGPLLETPTGMPPLFSGDIPMSLKDLLERLKEARQDSNVSAVVLDLEHAQLGSAQIQEIHAAVKQFSAVDKPVLVHADSLSNGTYMLATSATSITLTPTGDLSLTGLFAESLYLRGLLDKISVEPEFLHCGAYKSAAETLMRTGPTPEAEEMMNWIMDGLYESFVGTIAKGRGVTPEKVRQLIDNGPYSSEEAKAAGLIDDVIHRQEFVSRLKSRFGEDIEIDRKYGEKNPFDDFPKDPFMAMMKVVNLIMNPREVSYDEDTIAIVYVEGPIMTGEAEKSFFGGSAGAYSTTIRRALDTAAEEDSIKAVVMRVNSPGGSALASEVILDAARRVAAKKPIVVSMGDVAGSGGYYVTCASDTIFADEMTITASIGVVGGKLITTAGWNRLGITFKEYERGRMAGIMASSEPWDDAEKAKISKYMDDIYGVFKGHVTAARGAKLTKPIEQLAEGRVFTGSQALQLGLVDKIGGLDDAIKFTASKAGLGEYDVRVLPEPENIFDMFSGGPEMGEIKAGVLAAAGVSPRTALLNSPMIDAALPLLSGLDPLRVQAVLTSLQRLELIRREGVVLMMPFEISVR